MNSFRFICYVIQKIFNHRPIRINYMYQGVCFSASPILGVLFFEVMFTERIARYAMMIPHVFHANILMRWIVQFHCICRLDAKPHSVGGVSMLVLWCTLYILILYIFPEYLLMRWIVHFDRVCILDSNTHSFSRFSMIIIWYTLYLYCIYFPNIFLCVELFHSA